MAELPRFRRSVGLPSSFGLQSVSPSQTSAGKLAAGLGTAAQGLGEFGVALDEIQKSKESAWVTRATGEAEVFSADLEQRLESEAIEGGDGHVDAFQSEFGAYASSISDTAPSDRARAAVDGRLLGITARGIRRRGAFQARAQISKRDADFSAGLDSQNAVVRTDPEKLEQVLLTIQDDINGSEPMLVTKALEAGQDPLTFIENFTDAATADAMEAAAMGLAESGDIDGARDVIDSIRGLDESRALAVDFAVNGIEADINAAEDNVDSVEVYNDTTNAGFGLAASGEITQQWIDQNAAILNDSDLRDFGTLINNTGINPRDADQSVVGDLLARAGSPGSDREALSYLASNVIAKDDFAAILAVRGFSRDAINARDAISNELAPAEFESSEIFNDSIVEFDRFVAANPGADREALRTKADTIATRGKQDTARKLRATLPLPSSLQSRNSINMESVKKAATSLHGALSSGKLTPEEAVLEARKLRAWSEMLENQNAP